MKTLRVVAAVVIVLLGVLFAGAMYRQSVADVSGQNPLPQNIDMAYKEVQMRGIPAIERYAIVDVAGRTYFVAKSEFDNLLIPQRIGEGLYRMEDGTLMVGLDIR